MNGTELMNKMMGGKRVWREGMKNQLSDLKKKYSFATQNSSEDHYSFHAKYDSEKKQYACMECGELMENRSKRASNHWCDQCKNGIIGMGVSTHTYLAPEKTI